MGNKINLTNGESYGVFIDPLTEVIELEKCNTEKEEYSDSPKESAR